MDHAGRCCCPEDIWTEFETAWQHILDSHIPKAPYIHMREGFRLGKAFSANLGWGHDSAFGVVNQCLSYTPLVLKQFRKKFGAPNAFGFRVDLHCLCRSRSQVGASAGDFSVQSRPAHGDVGSVRNVCAVVRSSSTAVLCMGPIISAYTLP